MGRREFPIPDGDNLPTTARTLLSVHEASSPRSCLHLGRAHWLRFGFISLYRDSFGNSVSISFGNFSRQSNYCSSLQYARWAPHL
jgi:hypothetical protein